MSRLTIRSADLICRTTPKAAPGTRCRLLASRTQEARRPFGVVRSSVYFMKFTDEDDLAAR
jgi:hypothetical protein